MNNIVRVYTGSLRHRRFSPVEHSFTMTIAMLLIDIAHWDELFKGQPLWSSRFFNFGWLREKDYLRDLPGRFLRERVNHAVQQATGEHITGRIELLTHPRYLGFLMNPISCFYCYRADNTLAFMVAEVTNTPWRERIAYVLRCDSQRRKQHLSFAKQMHVSPFNPLDMTYRMHFNQPDTKLNLHLANLDASGNTVTDATLLLQAQPDTHRALQRLPWQFPLMSWQVAVGIYLQAFRLWRKGSPVHDHRAQLGKISPLLPTPGKEFVL